MLLHPRGLRAITIAVFGKQNTYIRLEPFKINVLEQITKHIEKLQCGGVVKQLSRRGNNQHISSTYDINRADTQVRRAVNNYDIIVMSNSFNGQSEHQVWIGGQFTFIKFAH
ncbi:hypothetical protein EN35_36755 [Rhodococcus qingshengii]|nr:hypothetical protein EN35_36755 [Rhodococcus qingshengii]MCT7373401.1 hypothetical protein [Mycolicibacterium llatzerense]